MENLTKLTLCRQTELLQSGEIRASELTEAYLKNIEQTEDKIGAYITLTAGQAIEKAAEIDRRRAAGEKLSPLAGHSGSHQRQHLHAGDQNDLRFQNAGKLYAALRRDRRSKACGYRSARKSEYG